MSFSFLENSTGQEDAAGLQMNESPSREPPTEKTVYFDSVSWGK